MCLGTNVFCMLLYGLIAFLGFCHCTSTTTTPPIHFSSSFFFFFLSVLFFFFFLFFKITFGLFVRELKGFLSCGSSTLSGKIGKVLISCDIRYMYSASLFKRIVTQIQLKGGKKEKKKEEKNI